MSQWYWSVPAHMVIMVILESKIFTPMTHLLDTYCCVLPQLIVYSCVVSSNLVLVVIFLGLNALPFDPTTNSDPLHFNSSNGPLVTECPSLENAAENGKKRKRTSLPPGTDNTISLKNKESCLFWFCNNAPIRCVVLHMPHLELQLLTLSAWMFPDAM